MSAERELLRRLVALCETSNSGDPRAPWVELRALHADARALLSKPEGPVAEGRVDWSRTTDGRIQASFQSDKNEGWDYYALHIARDSFRIPVPEHVWKPRSIDGEVVGGEHD